MARREPVIETECLSPRFDAPPPHFWFPIPNSLVKIVHIGTNCPLLFRLSAYPVARRSHCFWKTVLARALSVFASVRFRVRFTSRPRETGHSRPPSKPTTLGNFDLFFIFFGIYFIFCSPSFGSVAMSVVGSKKKKNAIVLRSRSVFAMYARPLCLDIRELFATYYSPSTVLSKCPSKLPARRALKIQERVGFSRFFF